MPGPVPALPASSTNPGARPRLCAGTFVPRVSVIAPAMVMSSPAHSVMLPSVAVNTPVLVSEKLRPAFSNMLPLVVVIAARTVMSRPQQITKLPLVAVIAKFTFTSRSASNFSVVVLGDAVQLIASLTVMSPLPVVPELMLVTGGAPATVVVEPVAVLIVTLLVTSSADSVAPEMSPPIGAMVKS
ncbi:hypothetical protein D9M73_116890 [compost metagenome]